MGWFATTKPKPRPSSKASSKCRKAPPPLPHPHSHPHSPIHSQTPPPPYGVQQSWPPQPQFQPAGYLPAPPGWTPGSPTPIVVNQYYLSPNPGSSNSSNASGSSGCSTFNNIKDSASAAATRVNDVLPGTLQIPPPVFDDGLPAWHAYGTQLLNQGAALYDQISSKFNHVMTSIDRNKFEGSEKEMARYGTATQQVSRSSPEPIQRGPPPKKSSKKDKKALAMTSSVVSTRFFIKTDYYSNSKLPLDLDPLKLTVETWPLISLAATYAESVYESPRGPERSTHIDADWKMGTKAMVIKSVANTTFKAIVFAIRGTATFMDWVVNLNMAPTSPGGFLDDPGNLCHAGFLSVARRMVGPVAARLRQLLEEDPRRAKYSLIITGHSAGGAVASLLFSHMLATSSGARSELNDLIGSKAFRRVHCITFGTPPVSLLPLQKPDKPRLKNWLFMNFVNEGDPVARADKEYVKSLLELYSTPIPGEGSGQNCPLAKIEGRKRSSSLSRGTRSLTKSRSESHFRAKRTTPTQEIRLMPTWSVPPCTLSCPGNIYVMRSGEMFHNYRDKDYRVHYPQAPMRNKGKKTVEERADEGVVVQKVTDEQLRGMIWGDPVCHVMRLYTLRIETLAIGAVTWGGCR
ncbi:hypothetical protein MKZ38_009031 [Zalerion maritima]|uniref:Fungal lipase-type domain-containing protein n=1 Tax=Zalerion maritima TaxID=339359 RepID=A0AAD5RVE1_9PEZI|nr:hypothetical protein MKZ38_009031 [Zalerion maritima]